MKLGYNELSMHNKNACVLIMNKAIYQLVKDLNIECYRYSNGRLYLERNDPSDPMQRMLVYNGYNVHICSNEVVRAICAWFAVDEGKYCVSYDIELGEDSITLTLKSCKRVEEFNKKKTEANQPTEKECIDLLKSLGYKIMKPITQYEEV